MEDIKNAVNLDIMKILDHPENFSGEVIDKELEKSNLQRVRLEKSLNTKLIGYFENIGVCEKLLKDCERKRRESKVHIKDIDNLVKEYK